MEEVKDKNEPPRKDLGRSESYAGAHVSWDERIIAEHDELRGTRQKINEPDTPYHYCTGDDIDMSVSYSSNNSQSGSISSTGVKADWDDVDLFDPGSYHSSVACSEIGSLSEQKNSVDLTTVGVSGQEQSKWLMQEIQMRLPTSKALNEERSARWGGEEAGDSGRSSRAPNTDFMKKRAAHYNEFQKMKEWRASQGAGSTDGDDYDNDSDSTISDL